LKPNCKKLELRQSVEQTPIYDTGMGEQLALNVDGAFRDKRDSKDNFFQR